jgi:hypothetical protein
MASPALGYCRGTHIVDRQFGQGIKQLPGDQLGEMGVVRQIKKVSQFFAVGKILFGAVNGINPISVPGEFGVLPG